MSLSNQPTGTREAAAERRVRALELRQKGNSYRAIACQLGVSEAQDHKDVHASLRALAEQEMSTAEELRALELERLDALLLIVSDEVDQGNLAAVDRALRIGERRAKLLGLDAPQRTDTTVTLDVRTLADGRPRRPRRRTTPRSDYEQQPSGSVVGGSASAGPRGSSPTGVPG